MSFRILGPVAAATLLALGLMTAPVRAQSGPGVWENIVANAVMGAIIAEYARTNRPPPLAVAPVRPQAVYEYDLDRRDHAHRNYRKEHARWHRRAKKRHRHKHAASGDPRWHRDAHRHARRLRHRDD